MAFKSNYLCDMAVWKGERVVDIYLGVWEVVQK